MAATIAYVQDIGWSAPTLTKWMDAKGRAHPVNAKAGQAEVLESLASTVNQPPASREDRVALEGPQSGSSRPWQAALFHEKTGGVKTCPRCDVPCTWEHAIFDCTWWRDKGVPLFAGF